MQLIPDPTPNTKAHTALPCRASRVLKLLAISFQPNDRQSVKSDTLHMLTTLFVWRLTFFHHQKGSFFFRKRMTNSSNIFEISMSGLWGSKVFLAFRTLEDTWVSELDGSTYIPKHVSTAPLDSISKTPAFTSNHCVRSDTLRSLWLHEHFKSGEKVGRRKEARVPSLGV